MVAPMSLEDALHGGCVPSSTTLRVSSLYFNLRCNLSHAHALLLQLEHASNCFCLRCHRLAYAVATCIHLLASSPAEGLRTKLHAIGPELRERIARALCGCFALPLAHSAK